MITEWFINLGFSVSQIFFSLLPDFEWSVVSSSWVAAKSILDGICYFLPLSTVTSIISLVIGLAFIRVTIKFIGLIIQMIPFI